MRTGRRFNGPVKGNEEEQKFNQRAVEEHGGKLVGAGVIKKDAMALVTGKPVYTDDIAPENCLVVKVLRSPHAHALIQDIDISAAEKVPGIECIITWKDVPQKRFTLAGQTYPEPSPYDRLILDQRVRFVGDPAAIVAGETEEAMTTIMPCAGRKERSAGQPGYSAKGLVLPWRYSRICRVCSSTSAISLQKKKEREAACITRGADSVWKPSIIRMPATRKISRPLC